MVLMKTACAAKLNSNPFDGGVFETSIFPS